jgi:hypothetical protein
MRLVLRRERLAELTTEELHAVAAGVATRDDSCHITFYPCITDVDCPYTLQPDCFATHEAR